MNPELQAILQRLSVARPDAMPTPGGRPSAMEQMRGMADAGAKAAVALSPVGSIQAAQQDFASGHPIMGAINAASAVPFLKPARVGTRFLKAVDPVAHMALEAEQMMAKNARLLEDSQRMLRSAGYPTSGAAARAANPGRENFVSVFLSRLPNLK
jgi:hypothetical protein